MIPGLGGTTAGTKRTYSQGQEEASPEAARRKLIKGEEGIGLRKGSKEETYRRTRNLHATAELDQQDAG